VRAFWLVLVAIVVLGAGGLGVFFAGGNRARVSAGPGVAGETATVRIPVQGMTCAVCAASVRKALESVEGVWHTEVNLERREARVQYGEAKVSPQQLVAAINGLGYEAGLPVPDEAPR